MDFYDQLKDLCANEGVSVSKLEKDLGFSNGSLSKGVPNAHRLYKIAQYFNMPMEYFVLDEETRNKQLNTHYTTHVSVDSFAHAVTDAQEWQDKYKEMHQVFDVSLRLRDDPEVYVLVERMEQDKNYRERILKMAELMEGAKDDKESSKK